MIVYNASSNNKIKKLYNNSYVTLFPHIAYFMGLYYQETGKPWNDDDLEKPYKFKNKIYFKKNRKPTGIPTLYKLEIKSDNIIMHDNFPFEFIIKKGVTVKKINKKDYTLLLKKSKKYSKLCDYINF